MTSKPDVKKPLTQSDVAHPGMMGDGTEEQKLNEKGNPAARITEAEVDAAFGEKARPKADDKR